MAAPRLSLVHQTVLLLVFAVLLAIAALGGVVAWNLRSGFHDYLRQQDRAWLERFVAAAAAAVQQQGLGVLQGPPRALERLLIAAGPADQRDDPLPEMPPARPHPPRDGRPGGGPTSSDAGHPPPHRMPPGAQRFANRLALTLPDGRSLGGRPPQQHPEQLVQPIVVDGHNVALATLVPEPPPDQGVDAAFLARQYRGILVATAALSLVAVAGAVWVGRRWLRPVQEARQAAHRIAQGAFDTRLRPRGNDELADLSRDINAMASALQQLEASRRRWIAELSHEMRTPLAVLRGEVECMLDDVRPLDRVALESLQSEVARLTRLVEDFHQLALSDLRALPCNFAPVDVAALMREAVARFAHRATAAGLTLTLLGAEATRPAHWDAQRIDQLLDNLLENSLRYTQAPGQVQLTLLTDAKALRLILEDSAPGVPLAVQTKLFEPLFRVDGSRSRNFGGSGLGLAICLALVRSHGGRITAADSPLGGLRIEVCLPHQASEAA